MFIIVFQNYLTLKQPDAIYNKGDDAWLTIEGKDGSFKVVIDSEGKWEDSQQQHKYQVRQTDGKL